MMHWGMLLLVVVLNFASGSAFVPKAVGKRVSALRMQQRVTVVGAAGGVAEAVACKLHRDGRKVAVVLDRPPLSPVLAAVAKTGELPCFVSVDLDGDDSLRSAVGTEVATNFAALARGSQLLCASDSGSADLRGDGDGDDGFGRKTRKIPNSALPLLAGAIKAMSSGRGVNGLGVTGVTVAMGVADEEDSGPLSGLLRSAAVSSTAFQSACEAQGLQMSLLRHGMLEGGLPGREPVPFMGLPLASDPMLHPTYSKRAAVLATAFGGPYDQSDVCTRELLCEALVRTVSLDRPASAFLAAVEGNPLGEDGWRAGFARVSQLTDGELLSVPFTELAKPVALQTWLANTWFPQALVDSDAAVILSGARPVRCRRVGAADVDIQWERVNDDLSVAAAGGLRISLIEAAADKPPRLAVTRLSPGALPGETELLDNLLAGMNTIYKRGLASPA